MARGQSMYFMVDNIFHRNVHAERKAKEEVGPAFREVETRGGAQEKEQGQARRPSAFRCGIVEEALPKWNSMYKLVDYIYV
ncbi:hypothetical protein BC936DRAFT_137245 [Jimgerdemannia flammicorona]|uniref:Uncharacterized protein n=1 Tax=Jimgerdemannia flammicorona TaxID=994334 RepID=A0A433CXU1_9FUNG|nr:hypothetical protein BC936DRAFT_137245 [Jimgerdemannia flammicorona]